MEDAVPHPRFLASFVRAVAVLALPATGQVQWLDSLPPFASWNVDELATEYEAGFVLVPQWVTAGWLAADVLVPARELNLALELMSGETHASLWTREALVRASQWHEVRRLAAQTLIAISSSSHVRG